MQKEAVLAKVGAPPIAIVLVLVSPARWSDKLSELHVISSWRRASSLAGKRPQLFPFPSIGL